MKTMSVHISAEVSDDVIVADIIEALEKILPYMCDNVVVTSHTRDYTKPSGTHADEIERLRKLAAVNASASASRLRLAADLLELHDTTGISLDDWQSAREFVEMAIGREISENGA